MKKIITALLNKTVNEKLREYKEINVIMNDIQYQDGIIEALEINKDIEYIILSELLPGEFNLKELIENIKKINNNIKIIIILEKENKELENYLFTKGNINIFYNNEIEIKDIVNLIINKKQNEDLQKEIQELKEIIFNNKKDENNLNNNYEKENIQKNTVNDFEKYKLNKDERIEEINITEEEKLKIEKEIENEFKEKLLINKIKNKLNNLLKKEEIKKESKIITFLGVPGVGKSVSIINIAKSLQKTKNKILIIDLDFVNNSIQTLFGTKNKIEKNNDNYENNYLKEFYKNEINEKNINKNSEHFINKKINQKNNNEENSILEKLNIKKYITKINSKIDLMSKINLLSDNELEKNNILKTIKELKLKYNLILIDTGNCENNYFKILINESEKIIFITEPNIIQIKKSKNLLEKYINEEGIEKEKIYLLFNKIKSDTISFNILKNVFKDYSISGQINFIKNCNTLINQSMNEFFLEKEIKKQYKKIGKEILKNKKIKEYYLEKIKINDDS